MSKWVCAWGVPTSYVNTDACNMIEDTTLKYTFYTPISGEKVRLRFSNAYGEDNAVISEAGIAEWAENEVASVPESFCKITFNNNGNVIKAGGELLTDEIEYRLEAGKKYVISIYFKDAVRITTGYSKYTADVLSPCRFTRGNRTEDTNLLCDISKSTTHYYFLCGVDVLSDDNTNAVMAFGDSITARPWPDFLARRINAAGITNRSVVRKAIGGNRVLRDYRNVLYRRHMGRSAIERFEMSLMQTPGVDKVIMLEGINDLFHPQTTSPHCPLNQLPTADELIAGYKYCCDIAHKYGVKFYLATILPTAHMVNLGNNREELRQTVNEWIRTNDLIDGFIEFDKAIADKNAPYLMAKEYDCGDTLHPNDNGSQLLCDTVPEHIFIS